MVSGTWKTKNMVSGTWITKHMVSGTWRTKNMVSVHFNIPMFQNAFFHPLSQPFRLLSLEMSKGMDPLQTS